MENTNLSPLKNQQTGLMNYSNQELILKECSDKTSGLKHIAVLLQRLAKLYQIPNWGEENAVMLAQWIFENYKYETFKMVTECLYNPPKTENKNWRLTPDTIQEWMALQLDKEAERREKEHQKLKQAELSEPIVLPDFDQLFKGTWYEEAKKESSVYWDKVKEAKQELISKRNAERNRQLQEKTI